MPNKKNNIAFGGFMMLLLGLISISFISEDNLLNKLISGLESYKKENLQEKVYLHIDNSYYIAGEDINFKGYLTNAYNTASKGLSKVMYTELYNDNNVLVAKHKSMIKNGFSLGNIILEDTLKSGVYSIVSYTNWMKNFNENYFFKRKIQIFNSNISKETEKKTIENIDIQFFPEGGELVNSLVSKVGFKATNSQGVGIKISAEIYNNHGNKVAEIASNNLGMGAFPLKPIEGEKYHAKLKNTEMKKEYKLPSQLTQGLVISVNNLGEEYISVNIQRKGSASKNVLIILQSKAEIHYYVKTKITSKGIVTKISKSKLPPGVCQITVFDLDTQIPIMERLVFIQGEKPLKMSIDLKKKEYYTREKVSVKIKVDDTKGLPIKGNFSLSISNRNQDIHSDNLNSYLLLASELKGEIENPNYYFQNNQPNAKRDLDYLMLTQGWRRFTWQSILDNKSKKHIFELELGGLFSIKNRILSKGKPIENEHVSVLLVNQLATYQSRTNAEGVLNYNIIDFFGDETFIYQITTDKSRTVNIDHSYQNIYKLSEKNFSDNVNENDTKKSVENYLINTTYKNISKNSKKIATTIYSKNNYSLLYDRSVNLKKYISFPDITEVFREIVAGVSVVKNKEGENTIKIYAKDISETFALEPLYIINGIPTFDTKYILALETSIVESIGIIHSQKALERFGEIGKNGVLVFNVSNKVNKANDSNIFSNSGFNITKEFYSPKYENQEIKNNSIPDFRSVLYWNPTVITDENGEATIEFYTSDEISNYRIDIQGLSSTGQIGALNQEFINVTLPTSMK